MLVVYHPDALREMQDAAQAYEDERPGLGDRFLNAADDTIDLLSRFPSSGRDIGDGVRYHPLKRYPYSAVYELHPDVIRVVAVAHHRRAPGYWRGRL